MSQNIFIPSFSLQPNRVVLYDFIESNYARNYHQFDRNTTHKVGMSQHSAKRIKKAVDWLFYCSKKKYVHNKVSGKRFHFRLNFVTLTLSSKQVHSDKVILKQLLEPFIRVLRNSIKGFLYVWKAEVQDNGNLHFHINTNVFLDKQYVQEQWNIRQSKLGYVSESEIQTRPSTRVEAVFNASELSNYLSKYLAKGDRYKKPLVKFMADNAERFKAEKKECFLGCGFFYQYKRKIDIKLWDCSRVLKGVKVGQIGTSPEEHWEIQSLRTYNNVFAGDYFEVITSGEISHKKTPLLHERLQNAVAKILAYDERVSSQILIDLWSNKPTRKVLNKKSISSVPVNVVSLPKQIVLYC